MRHAAPHCKGCGRRPDEIREYILPAEDLDITVDQYVRENEGTYDPTDGSFLCTACYFKAHQEGVTA